MFDLLFSSITITINKHILELVYISLYKMTTHVISYFKVATDYIYSHYNYVKETYIYYDLANC